MKKRKFKLKNFLNEFKPIIDNHKNELPIFDLKNKYNKKKIETFSWFDITKQKDKHQIKCNILMTDNLDQSKFKCIKVKMILSKIHKKIFQNSLYPSFDETIMNENTKHKKMLCGQSVYC